MGKVSIPPFDSATDKVESKIRHIQFSRVAAARKRAERCCRVWHIDGAYDTLVEVEDPPWVAEIRADTREQWRD